MIFGTSDKTVRITSENSVKRKFGNRLLELRNQRKLSQDELAGILNLDRSYISLVETGRINVTIVTASRIAKALRVPMDELFKF